MKRCTLCHRLLTLNEFHIDRYMKDGHAYRCKSCANTALRERRETRGTSINNPEKQRAYNAARYLANREPIRERVKLYYERNKTIIAEKTRAKYAANPAHYREKRKSYAATHQELLNAHSALRRARRRGAKGNGWTAAAVRAIMTAQKGRCALCKKKLGKTFHRDHIVPLARGGTHDRKNLQLLCPACNIKKGARDPIEYAQLIGLLL